MEDDDFNKRMELADGDMIRQGIPVHMRWFWVHQHFASGPHHAFPESFTTRISTWYTRRYGDAAMLHLRIGKVPIEIRGHIFEMRIPRVYGRVKYEILPLIQGLTLSLAQTFTTEERDDIRTTFEDGCALVYEVDEMRRFCFGNLNGTKRFSKEIEDLLELAVQDREAAVESLVARSDGNQCAFHAQQYAEKFMKALFASQPGKSLDLTRTRHRHNLMSLWNDLVLTQSSLAVLRVDVERLSKISMEVRYSEIGDPRDSILMFRASLRVAGATACLISGMERRFRDRSLFTS